ncbi:hypothetical protein BGZ46_001412 [Entomortierella lignicola]|nr:hypothetical protein BGZ46_001412 [Entomortierella lignicola]
MSTMYLWQRLAWRDYSFTAARGLWKLEFLKDRDLRLCFPHSASVWTEEGNLASRMRGKVNPQRSSICKACKRRLRMEMEGLSLDNAQSTSYSSNIQGTEDLSSVTSRHNSENPTAASCFDQCSCKASKGQKGKRRADSPITEATEGPKELYSVDSGDDGDNEVLELKDKEQDWKALYQMTSNWYKGKARGYCPLMLPSLTSLAMATQTLSGIPSSSTATATTTSSNSIPQSGLNLSTPAQRGIQKILKKRKPLVVVGLQHEGSAQTSLTLASYPKDEFSPSRDEVVNETATSCTRTRQVTLIRSNPHYRLRRPSSSQVSNQLLSSANNSLLQSHQAEFDAQGNLQNPNVIAQDPLEHDQVVFAIRASPPQEPVDGTNTNDGLNGIGQEASEGSAAGNTMEAGGQQQQTLQDPPASPVGPQISNNPANDILCHYSSPLHSFLVTGHMDGGVRLWDMSIKEPGKQCVRYWQTGARRRVLCVGMNSKVVVCGNANSTLCVWDIHPGSNSSTSSYGTIHAASFLSSTSSPGLEDWTAGIEHICVSDSLVACSTEFSGSVLVFSLATGSLVYEIPGLYQPSKMCMTDFFLLTGGRGTWNQGVDAMRNQQQQQQQQHVYQHNIIGQNSNSAEAVDYDFDPTDRDNGRNDTTIEVDDYMSCCVNVWDLKTGNRLYSLIPRLSMQNIHRTRNHASKVKNTQSQEKNREIAAESNINPRSTTIQSPHVDLTEQNRVNLSSDNSSIINSNAEGSSHQLRDSVRINTTSSVSRQTPASAPLTLMDIAVTPDHSTLVVTLCERYGEGKEGVYCWDFTGSRLEGYHEQGTEVSTMILDKTNIEYSQGSSNCSTSESQPFSEELRDDSEVEGDDDRYSNDRLSNNMAMQQVDSSVLRELHQARITGKVWIGWKLDEHEFQKNKAANK